MSERILAAAAASSTAQSGERPPALYDLGGELGGRARIAWSASISIEQCVDALIQLNEQGGPEFDFVFSLLHQRIKELAGVIMSCASADDTLANLLKRAGMKEAP